MLPPSMIRNVNNGAIHRKAGTSDSGSGNKQLEGSVSIGTQQPNGNSSSSNINNNQSDLLQQLRLLTSQLPGSSSQNPATVQQNMLRPEVPQSNIAVTTTATVMNNKNIGTMANNPIDVDIANSNSSGSDTSSPTPDSNLFPYILHGMLDDVERSGQTNIVSWNADGKSFRIQDPDAFVSFILGKYFKNYVGGIASRFTQFRSDLMDWGFEDAVDGNRMVETFTHHCFQKGQANLCRYMRCGRKAVEPTPAKPAPTRPVQAQSAPMPSKTNVVANANTITLGNAAQLLLGQQLQQAQAKQQQQQALQQQALQLQALLNGVSNGNNPVATMSLIQLLMGQQQQQQPQVMAAVAALQRQQQNVVAGSNSPVIKNASQNQSPVITKAPMNKEPVGKLPAKASVISQVKARPIGKIANKTVTSRPTVSAKRAAFLNKRSKATGTTYRNPNKKQKRSPTNAAMVLKNRKKSVVTKSSALALNKNAANINAFTLNEDFKEKEIPDLLFPWKLHDMLDDTELIEDLKTNVVSWQADGVSFNIHDKDRFVEEVIPKYFEKVPKEWDCFLNILSSWGFVRFTSGTQKGAFIHRLLVKGKRSICKMMRINGKTVSDWMKQHGQFIGRLHALLTYAEKQGKRDIVSWTPDGKKFRILDPSRFMNSVFPTYFDSLTYSSFEQKLRRWGFMRSPASHQKKDKETRLENATYSHPHFVRGKLPNLVWVKSDTKIPRTLQQHNFLVRLRVMLSDASRHGFQYVVSWAPHGKAFMIHDRPYFSNKIMPNYFKSKFTSFRQSLRNHGFAQIGGNGWDEGAYYHKHFIREEPHLCQGLTQDQMKKAMPEWIPVEDEPNFYPAEIILDSEVSDAASSMVSLKSTPSPTNLSIQGGK